MKKQLLIVVAAALVLAVPLTAAVEEPNHQATAGLTQPTLVSALQHGTLTNKQARQLGLLVFSTPFNKVDGLGDGPFDINEWNDTAHGGPIGLGHRPTLQGNGQFLRVNGLDAQSCNECHGFVSQRTLPPTLGIGGVGGAVQNAIIMPSLIDVADSFDDRVSYVANHDPDLPLGIDGVADFNGRFANPPFLYGGGGVELLAKEMTADLQALKHQAENAPAGTVVSLDTHGVNFGYIVSQGGTNIDVHNEGVDHDLVVKPFGRKGDAFSMRDFDRGAMQFHFGIQPEELFGHADSDGDGVSDEVTVAEMSVLHIFDVNNPRPHEEKQRAGAVHGKQVFLQAGCANCHRPELKTVERSVPLAYPEIADQPFSNVYYTVDLTKVGFDADKNGSGVVVPLYSDLKRHDMGPGLAETFERAGEIPQEDFITARLWGIADTAPYLHDGRATTLNQAILMHGGEAQTVRDYYANLSDSDKSDLIAFLKCLRTPVRPNEDLLPLNF